MQRLGLIAAAAAVLALGGVLGARDSRGAAGETLQLRLWPAGQGRIDLDQAGRDRRTCDFVDVLVSTTSQTCTFDVTSGTPLTLTATAEPGKAIPSERADDVPDYASTTPSTFVRWSRADCAGRGPCAFTPDSNDEWITAIFTPLQLEVGINGGNAPASPVQVQQANGSLQPLTCDGRGFDTAGHACHGLFPADADVVLIAPPASPTVPIRWGSGCRPNPANAARCTVTMSNIRTFASLAYGDSSVDVPQFPFQITSRLTVRVSGSGRVTGPEGIDCPSACTVDLGYQTPVTLTAAPDEGARFLRWRGVCATSATCTFAAGSSSSVSAVFGDAATVGIRVTGLSASGRGARRVVRVTILSESDARATVRLLRNGRAKATRTLDLVQGRNALRLAVPRGLTAGTCVVSVRAQAGSSTATATRSLRIGR